MREYAPVELAMRGLVRIGATLALAAGTAFCPAAFAQSSTPAPDGRSWYRDAVETANANYRIASVRCQLLSFAFQPACDRDAATVRQAALARAEAGRNTPTDVSQSLKNIALARPAADTRPGA
jgi:hypothetical protein